MNKARRKWLSDVVAKLENIQNELTQVAMEEQESYDNIPDYLNCSDKAMDMEENIDEINDIAYELDGLVTRISDIIDK